MMTLLGLRLFWCFGSSLSIGTIEPIFTMFLISLIFCGALIISHADIYNACLSTHPTYYFWFSNSFVLSSTTNHVFIPYNVLGLYVLCIFGFEFVSFAYHASTTKTCLMVFLTLFVNPLLPPSPFHLFLTSRSCIRYLRNCILSQNAFLLRISSCLVRSFVLMTTKCRIGIGWFYVCLHVAWATGYGHYNMLLTIYTPVT